MIGVPEGEAGGKGKQPLQASGSANNWWLRSVQSSTNFANVNNTGNFNWNNANNSNLPCA